MTVFVTPEPTTPVTSLHWADGTGHNPVTEPTEDLKDHGYVANRPAAAAEFNWFFNLWWQWLTWLRYAVGRLDLLKFGADSDLIPTTNNAQNIGTDVGPKWWLNLFARHANVQDLTLVEVVGHGGMKSDVSPYTDEGFNLGTSTLRWNDAHIANVLAGDVDADVVDAIVLAVGTGVGTDLPPTGDAEQNLGVAGKRWKEGRIKIVVSQEGFFSEFVQSDKIILTGTEGTSHAEPNRLIARSIPKAYARIGLVSGGSPILKGGHNCRASGPLEMLAHGIRLHFATPIVDAAVTCSLDSSQAGRMITWECGDGSIGFVDFYITQGSTGVGVDASTITGDISVHIDGTQVVAGVSGFI